MHTEPENRVRRIREWISRHITWVIGAVMIPIIIAVLTLIGPGIINPPPGDFAISVNPLTGTVNQGGSIPFTINIEYLNGYSKDVILSCSGEPSGVVVSFDDNKMSVADCTATVTVNVAAEVSPNSYELTFLGRGSNGKEHPLVYTLVVSPQPPQSTPNVTISVDPNRGSASPGQSVQTTVTIARNNGYTKDISLSVSGQPSNVQVTFNPSTVKTSQSTSTMTIILSGNAPVGEYALTIKAEDSEGKSSQATYSLTINQTAPTVKITSPKNGESIDRLVTVQGTAQNLSSDQTLWVFIGQSSRYYPMANPVVVRTGGGWSCDSYVGGEKDAEKQFDIYAVLADSAAEAEINAYNTQAKNSGDYSGMTSLPEGATVGDKITITRKPVSSNLSSPTPTVKITTPANGTTVSKTATVQGTAQNIPTSQTVWLILYPPNVKLYYPTASAVTVSQSGTWQTTLTIGGANDTGQPFDIITYIVDQTGKDALVAYNQDIEKNHPGDYPGMAQLPSGLTEGNRVTVIRGPWT